MMLTISLSRVPRSRVWLAITTLTHMGPFRPGEQETLDILFNIAGLSYYAEETKGSVVDFKSICCISQ